MPDNDPKPGPSGVPKDDDDNNNNKKKPPEETKKILFKLYDRKPRSRAQNVQRPMQHHFRRASYDAPLRYRVPPRMPGLQASNSVRRIVGASRLSALALRNQNVRREKRTRLVVHQPDSSRRHNQFDALEFFYRSTQYGKQHHLDEIQQLRRGAPSMRIRERKRETYKLPRRYCRNCLEPLTNCICILGIDRPATSDWTVLLRQKAEAKVFTTPRGEWLNTLEKQTKVDVDKIADKKFDISQEVCCFPFNTFKIFAKRDVKTVDYYKKKIN